VKVRDVSVPPSAMAMRAAPRGSVAAALHISAAARRDTQDSAGDIRNYIQEKLAEVFTVVDDPDDAEVALLVQRREIRKGEGTDLTGQPAIKDFYAISGRVRVLDEVGSLEASQEFVSFAAWRDTAKAFTTELESYVQARQHRVLQARLGFPALGGTVEEMSDEWRSRLGVRKAKGAAFVAIEPGGPAASAAIRPGDGVVEIDGKKTKHAWDVARMVWERGPGAQLRLKLRRDDAERSVKLTTGAPRKDPRPAAAELVGDVLGTGVGVDRTSVPAAMRRRSSTSTRILRIVTPMPEALEVLPACASHEAWSFERHPSAETSISRATARE
jgi:membrane-associated protease RseP (regulator of RpoE activity)